MKENLVLALQFAIDMKMEVQVELSSGETNSVCVSFIPDAFELSDNELIIWHGTDVFTVDIREILYNESVNEYACGDAANAIYISF